MKAAILDAYDTEVREDATWVRYEDTPDPEITGQHDVIVKIGGAGVCRTDLHVIEGLWKEISQIQLPYIMGHENAGWVEAVGRGVEHVKVGQPVICHPLVTHGHDLACRRGDDMRAEDSVFPGLNANGGYAELLKTHERAIITLPQALAPKDVAPHADAGLTAYRAAKKASRHLLPGQLAVIIGAGGLGHIGIQVLRSMCAADIAVVDRSKEALEHAKDYKVDHLITADGSEVDQINRITKDHGAEAVIDFVGEGSAIANGLAMTCHGGTYYVVGYGGRIDLPTMEMIVKEKNIVGSLVGTYSELFELMELADRGHVDLVTQEYSLQEADKALHDLSKGQVHNRGVLIP